MNLKPSKRFEASCKPVMKTCSFFWVPLQVTVLEISSALSNLLIALVHLNCVILMQPNQFPLPILRVTLTDHPLEWN